MSTAKPYHTYILECADGTYYIGWTNDLEKRLVTHNEGKGAKYTRARLPVELAYHESFKTESEARKREYELKRWTRKRKERLVRGKEL